jgi:hypothetical protein
LDFHTFTTVYEVMRSAGAIDRGLSWNPFYAGLWRAPAQAGEAVTANQFLASFAESVQGFSVRSSAKSRADLMPDPDTS